MQKTNVAVPPVRYKGIGLRKGIKKYWMLYAMMILPLAQYIIFRYCPLWGVQVAFKDYNLFKGIAGSKWAGFKYFNEAFATQQFWDALKNTVWLNLLDLIFGFPMPIILAIMLYAFDSLPRGGLFFVLEKCLNKTTAVIAGIRARKSRKRPLDGQEEAHGTNGYAAV